MRELKCPNCHSAFTVDEADYAAILSQVKNQEFQAELDTRLQERLRLQQKEEEARALKREQAYRDQAAKLTANITQLQEQINSIAQTKTLEYTAKISAKEQEISLLQQQIRQQEQHKQLEIRTQLHAKEQELQTLQSKIEQYRKESENQCTIAVMQEQQRNQATISGLLQKISDQKLAAERELNSQKELDNTRIKYLEQENSMLKDYKARQSTKMIGESLELHCSNAFNLVRNQSYPTAYFEKDNDTKPGGTKGDFIFRDTIDGVEYISIMFEMKNEMPETTGKHKNEDFYAKLDKDRNEKGCEYAVLVTLLEADSEYFNNGIVDVSHHYPKMYVIRPQFFMPLIALLTQAGKNSIAYQKELIEAKNQSIDVTHFEEKLEDFKKSWGNSVLQAKKRYDEAINEIDKSIKAMQMVKEKLLASSRQLTLSDSKAEDVTIKKLTRGNATMKQKFAEARRQSKDIAIELPHEMPTKGDGNVLRTEE